MLRRSLIPIALFAGLLLPATAGAKTVTATRGGVTAKLSYAGSEPHFTNLRLSITRGGRSLYSGAVTARECGHACWPQTGVTQPAVQIADVQGDGAADVLLNLYTGGAHCCSLVQVFAPSAAMGGAYVLSASHDFGDPGYRLSSLGGKQRFVTGNDAFAYEFTDFAGSGLPLQIFALTDGRFTDVTRSYPALVRRDAARWLTAYRKARGQDNVGLIAAWAADQCTLGNGAKALDYVQAQARAGRLNSALGRPYSGARFVARLRAFLAREGYLKLG